MDALRLAAPLARLLLALGESGREGEVSVVQHGRTAKLSLAAGRAVLLTGVDVAPLGDTLLALGALDVPAQSSFLLDGAWASAGTPIGARLIAAGATSSAAVACALELQLATGIESLLRWPARRVGLARRALPPGQGGAAGIDLAAAVWSALLALAQELPASLRTQLSGSAALTLTGAGKRRVSGLLRAIEYGELQAALRRRGFWAALDRPVRAPDLTRDLLASALRSGATHDGQVLRCVLRALGAAIERPALEDACGLLLRKRRQLARNVSARALLDLPEAASAEQAGRALRRLAQKLHPDRFHTGDARLLAVSTEVMGALTRAERALRTSSTPPPASA